MSGIFGRLKPSDLAGNYNPVAFIIQQLINRINSAAVVKVMAVTPGGEGPVGFVDVQPLVNQIDGAGVAVSHSVIFQLPYFRLQGGINAVIIDPVIGDIGVAVFEDRDISSVKNVKGQANPGSRRRFDMADGLYLGGFLNGSPQQYVEFLSNGIKIEDINQNVILMQPGSVLITTPELRCTGQVFANWNTGDQVGLSTHHHTQPPDSRGDTEANTNAPLAGT